MGAKQCMSAAIAQCCSGYDISCVVLGEVPFQHKQPL
jgi:hypothetical protein